MKIKKVTMTGADDGTNITDLVKLTEKYPYVEWGILLSKSQEGGKRFPSYEWIRTLYNHKDKLSLSGHICGRWIRDMVEHGVLSFKAERSDLWDLFSRYQLNFHAECLAKSKDFKDCLNVLAMYPEKQFIFQYDRVNEDLFADAQKAGVNASLLFDLSHGAGICPEKWRAPLSGVYCGYAGGLGPDNLESELQRIDEVAGVNEIWIDMETKVRSNNDTLFDLEKVERCLEIAKPYVA